MRSIEHNYFWCAGFKNLNDPMEGKFSATTLARKHPRYDDAYQMITSGKSEVGLCAFSESNKNEVMWAHYADEFFGICISYNFKKLLNGLSDTCSFSRISYSEELPKMGKPVGDPNLSVRRIMSTKHHRWLYEREWRMFAPQQGENYYRSSEKSPVVAAVYLGFRMNSAMRDKIVQRMNSIGIRTYDMIVGDYVLKFKKIEQT